MSFRDRAPKFFFPDPVSRTRALRALATASWVAASLAGLWHAWSFARLSISRMRYPFELEWMEGGMLHQVVRVLGGLPLYPEPSPEFVPFLYGPGFTYTSAAVASFLSPDLFSLRLVSFASTLALFAILFELVHTETRSRLAGFVSLGLFAGTFEQSGAWFDLARADSLALALALSAIFVARRSSRLVGFAASGIILALAVLTKQTMLMALPAALLISLLSGGARALGAVSGGFLSMVLVLGALLQWQSQGWFSYYVLELPSTHGMKNRERLVTGFWKDEVFRALPIASTIALVFFSGFPLGMSRKYRLFYAVLGASLIVGAYASRLHMGSYVNDLMPAHAAMAILFALTLHGLGGGVYRDPSVAITGSLRALSCGLLAGVQLVLLSGDLGRFVPTRADYDAGQDVVERIRQAPGDVLVVNHPHLALLAGEPAFAHQMAMVDVFEADRDPRNVREKLRAEWRALFERKSFGMVVLDDDWYLFMEPLREHYQARGTLQLRKDALIPKTGTPLRPEQVFVPRGE